MTLTAGLRVLQSYGVPAASVDASLGSPCNAPAASINTAAAADKIVSYSTVSNIAGIKNALNRHFPVEMAFSVYTSFDDAFQKGTIYKTVSGTLRGAHAVCIIGYDDSKNAVLIQNSWGTTGGDATYKGCVWLDYSVFTNTKLGIELYMAYK